MAKSGAEGGKKISPSAFYFDGAAQGEPSAQLSSYTLICTDGLCGEERDCNARRDEWYLPSSLSRLQSVLTYICFIKVKKHG